MRTIKWMQTIENLEDIHENLSDIVGTGIFGEHKPDGCLICPAKGILDDIRDLIQRMNPPNSLLSGFRITRIAI